MPPHFAPDLRVLKRPLIKLGCGPGAWLELLLALTRAGAMLRLEERPHCGLASVARLALGPGALMLREIPLLALDREEVAREVARTVLYCTVQVAREVARLLAAREAKGGGGPGGEGVAGRVGRFTAPGIQLLEYSSYTSPHIQLLKYRFSYSSPSIQLFNQYSY